MKVTHDLGQRLQERAPRFALTLKLPKKLKYKRKDSFPSNLLFPLFAGWVPRF